MPKLSNITVGGAFATRDRLDARQREYGVKVRDNLCKQATAAAEGASTEADQLHAAAVIFNRAVREADREALREISMTVEAHDERGRFVSHSFVREL